MADNRSNKMKMPNFKCDECARVKDGPACRMCSGDSCFLAKPLDPAPQAAVMTIEPCPFCGGSDLTDNRWELDGGEVNAVE